MIDVIEFYEYESMTVMQSFIIDDLVEVRRVNKTVGVGWLTTNILGAVQDADFDKLQKLKVGVYRQMIDQPQLIASVRGLQNVNY